MPKLNHQLNFDNAEDSGYSNEFLLPEQRLNAIADILAGITKRILEKRHDENSNY